MKVSFYCQHVLGIGHFHRSLEICSAILNQSPDNIVTLILGGPEVEVPDRRIRILHLPGLKMDREFNHLTPCEPQAILDQVKKERLTILYEHFKITKPDIFVAELYPFGRKAFRFELDPVLEGIKNGSLPPCRSFSSVRDILVEKVKGKEKYEKRVVTTLNKYFDAVLIHADPTVVTLNETFDRMSEISPKLYYTGFVTPQISKNPEQAAKIRQELGLAASDKLIVTSIGGGNVGTELLFSVIDSMQYLSGVDTIHLQLFCGPYCDKDIFFELQSKAHKRLTISSFTDNFSLWLQAADLSISMGGYNTSMNLLQAEIPALVLPFQQNREQLIRAKKLSCFKQIDVLSDKELESQELARKIEEQLQKKKKLSPVNLDGAETTATLLQKLYTHGCEG